MSTEEIKDSYYRLTEIIEEDIKQLKEDKIQLAIDISTGAVKNKDCIGEKVYIVKSSFFQMIIDGNGKALSDDWELITAVSYTHLTLPTTSRV